MRALICSAALILVASLGQGVYAAALCVPGSVATYRDQADGCMIGVFTLKNFAWSSVQDTNFVTVSASDVLVNPVAGARSVEVTFNSQAFMVAGDNRIRAFLDYLIDPAPPILDDFNLSMNANTPVPPGTARIMANACIGDLFINSCANGIVRTLVVQNFGADNPANIPFASVKFPNPVNLVDVRTIIELDANGASSQITGYGTVTNATESIMPTPEPSVVWLTGAGLLGLLCMSLRRQRALSARPAPGC